MPSASIIYFAFDRMLRLNEKGDVESRSLAKCKARAERAQEGKRALEPMVCDQIARLADEVPVQR